MAFLFFLPVVAVIAVIAVMIVTAFDDVTPANAKRDAARRDRT